MNNSLILFILRKMGLLTDPGFSTILFLLKDLKVTVYYACKFDKSLRNISVCACDINTFKLSSNNKIKRTCKKYTGNMTLVQDSTIAGMPDTAIEEELEVKSFIISYGMGSDTYDLIESKWFLSEQEALSYCQTD